MAFLDRLVAAKKASSRAEIITRALEHERRREMAARDAAILAESGEDPTWPDLSVHDRAPGGPGPMRPIHTAHLDKARPVLVLTRELVLPHRQQVTVVPITATVRGLPTEVPVGPANGIGYESVVSCDNIVTIDKDALGERIGYLFPRSRTPAHRGYSGRLRPRVVHYRA